MAEMRAQIDVLQTFIDHCVAQHNAGKLTPQMAAEGKLLASELEGRVVDDCLQMHGGAATWRNTGFPHVHGRSRVTHLRGRLGSDERDHRPGVGLDDRKMK